MSSQRVVGPRNPVSKQVHREKYRIPGETFDDFSVRIANGVKDGDEHFHRMLDVVRDMRWLPAGRQQLAVGNAHAVTAFNCFVSGVIPDDSRGIVDTLKECFQTMRMGGGVGMDFSTLRPHGALIRSLGFGKFSVRLNQRFWLGAVYDTLSSDGELETLKFQYVDELPCFDPNDPFAFPAPTCGVRDSIQPGEVDVTRYGLTTTVILFGEPDMQIYLTGSAGVGEIDYTNPQEDESSLPLRPDEDFDGTADGQYTLEDVLLVTDRKDKTDIDLWYEFGGGIRFALGSGRFGLRLQVVYRRISPDGKNTVLPVGVSEIVPSAGFTVRF